MKIGILHLSDIHFTSKENFVLDRYSDISNSLKIRFSEIRKLLIIVSGDIANTSKIEEYDIATLFFQNLEKEIRSSFQMLNSINYVFVPGNHDCNFEDKNNVRSILIENILKKDDPEADVIESMLNVQSNFWDFYQNFLSVAPSKKISYQINIPVTINQSINLNCYNSSWMSQRNEVAGKFVLHLLLIN